jgi:D-lactate dehydrogenase
MKVAVYCMRDDEKEIFDKFSRIYNIEPVPIDSPTTVETAGLAAGCTGMSITTDVIIDKSVLDALYDVGVRFISTRTIGYEHIDLDYAAKKGIKVANIQYSPVSVADYAIMMMLMVLRKAKHIMVRAAGQDYKLSGIRGRELPELTVGVIGTGRIGATVIKHLSGFGCKILAMSRHENPEVKGLCRYVDLDTLYRESDIITLHAPSTAETYHMVNAGSIAKMKNGVVLINTARGALVDSDALIDGIRTGKIWGAGLDVIEGDREIYYRDRKYQVVDHPQMAILNSFPNVLVMPHTAFYTDEAVSDMVENSLKSCHAFDAGETIPGLLN